MSKYKSKGAKKTNRKSDEAQYFNLYFKGRPLGKIILKGKRYEANKATREDGNETGKDNLAIINGQRQKVEQFNASL